jgi:carboxylesterase type B
MLSFLRILYGVGLTVASFTLDTVRGPLIGYRSYRFPEVVTFTGIPYADQPVGDLRFRQTTALAHFPANAGVDGDLGKACPQTGNTSGPDWEGYTQDEGCLYFQLAVPMSFFATHKPIERALVTIHGGGFVGQSSGSARADFRRPAVLDGVASFSMNYRLGVLGFVTDDAQHYNAGFHDQQLALQVIADVAVALGVQRTLLAGNSAGASSAVAHLLATGTGYDAVLLQSPPAGVRLTTTGETKDRWNRLLVARDCQSISCLQNVSVLMILSFQATLLRIAQRSLLDSQADIFGLMPLGPVQDGIVFTDIAVRQYVAGAGRHDIPVMVGSVKNEALFSIDEVFPNPLPEWFYPVISSLLVGPLKADELQARYPLKAEDNQDIRGPIERAVTSWAFGCSVNDYVHGVSTGNIYYYYYTHPNTCSNWGNFCIFSSCHADDLLLFYNSSTPLCPSISAEEAILGAQWRDHAWTMLDGGEPWAHPVVSGSDGIEIGNRNWTEVTFDRTQNECAYWESFDQYTDNRLASVLSSDSLYFAHMQ